MFLKKVKNTGASHRTIGGVQRYYRSKWEANYARYLQFLTENFHIKGWLHEPYTFKYPISRGTTSFLVDFKVIENDGSHSWHEVKGFYDQKSRTKIDRFRRYFPEEKLIVIDKKFFSSNGIKAIKSLIKGWE